MNKYLGKREIRNIEEYEKRRQSLVSVKFGAVFNTFVEMEGLIDKESLANQYFDKSQKWLEERISGGLARDKKLNFTTDEYHQLAEALRDIAKRLNAHADEIDAASMDSPEDNE